MDTMDYIDEMIRENKDGRFEVISDDAYFRICKDTACDRLYSLDKRVDGNTQWHEVEYVAAMQKEAWEQGRFESAQDEDEFTDFIAFCPVSGEVLHDGVVWIVWFDVCD